MEMEFAFGYGSKVFSQGNNDKSEQSQIDMIYAVRNSIDWHNENLIKNSNDYSILKYGGGKIINTVNNWGAGVYFNPFVQVPVDNNNNNNTNIELKYGITSTNNLIDDLINWKSMYLAGRLHKPVAIIKQSNEFKIFNEYNLTNAVKLSLLLINKENITFNELFLKITELSYIGDPRLKVRGENPNKVKNIVNNQYEIFKILYIPILENNFNDLIQINKNDEIIKFNLTIESIGKILVDLPRNFKSKLLYNNINKYEYDEFTNDVIINPFLQIGNEMSYNDLLNIKSINEIPPNEWEYLPNYIKLSNSSSIRGLSEKFFNNGQIMQNSLINVIETIVGSTALVQSLKGILTAGIVRSYKYAIAKRNKAK
ncbi:putative phosphatidate cytidylyltransferase [Pichia kluyveri]|uniref:Phosphatidate cytidylyltransferase, mitochondrial n=1 Tax=Pichia kluyveri TaxID=36015 RepID=A0AAV5R027_PICKL|nr:putative phosphatidate cytidylyltransferase [Pichia kluyveri]